MAAQLKQITARSFHVLDADGKPIGLLRRDGETWLARPLDVEDVSYRSADLEAAVAWLREAVKGPAKQDTDTDSRWRHLEID